MATEYISREAAIELLTTALDDDWEPEYAQDRLSEIPAADVRPVNNRDIDGNELFRRIAGHSYYKGDDILTRISLMQEGKSPKKKDIEPANVRPVVRGVPLIEINEPWQPMRGNKDRFYYTKRYLCRNCEYQIKTESWEKDRCFGAGTIFKENSMPNFCPNCGADMRPIKEDGNV